MMHISQILHWFSVIEITQKPVVTLQLMNTLKTNIQTFSVLLVIGFPLINIKFPELEAYFCYGCGPTEFVSTNRTNKTIYICDDLANRIWGSELTQVYIGYYLNILVFYIEYH